MRTKKEILKSNSDSMSYVDDTVFDGSVETVYDAMDEYAKEVNVEAIRLLKRAYAINRHDMGFDVDVSEFFEKIGVEF